MKKKNGFTLIELLAVIVILAIIALIATPIVLGLISRARKGAAVDSAYGVRKEAQLIYSTALMEHPAGFNKIVVDFSKEITKDGKKYAEAKYYATPSTTDENAKTDVVLFELDGTKPSSGKVTIYGTGKIEYEKLIINNHYCCIPEQGEIVCSDKNDVTCTNSSSESSSSEDENKIAMIRSNENVTYKGVVYLNPRNLSVKCTSSNSQIGTGSPNASGCMKFYVFDETTENYKLILDHNTTAATAYNSTGVNSSIKEAQEALENDTSGWLGNPRLISADELADLTGASNAGWSSETATETTTFCLDTPTNIESTTSICSRPSGTNIYAWLFDYTNGCTSSGCNYADPNAYGYWTSTPSKTTTIASAWGVSGGRVFDRFVGNVSSFGVRPVIELNRNLFIVKDSETIDNSSSGGNDNVFYAIGQVDNSATTRYYDIMDLPNIGKQYFIRYEDYGTDNAKNALCINVNGTVDCFNYNDYNNEVTHFINFFSQFENNYCSDASSGKSCSISGNQWGCTMYQDGSLGCGGAPGGCGISSNGVSCPLQ